MESQINTQKKSKRQNNRVNSQKKTQYLLEHGYDPEVWTCRKRRKTGRLEFLTIADYHEDRKRAIRRRLEKRQRFEDAIRKEIERKDRPVKKLRRNEEYKRESRRSQLWKEDCKEEVTFTSKTGRHNSVPLWKIYGQEQKLLKHFRLLNEGLAKHGQIICDALREAQWILTRNPFGYLKTNVIRSNTHFRRCLRISNGDLIFSGILKLVDKSYEKGKRPQRYEIGEFAEAIEWWAQCHGLEDRITPRTVEEFNKRTIEIARKKGCEIVQSSIWTMYVSIDRLFNPLVYAKKSRKIELYRRFGFHPKNILTLDINCSMHSILSNLCSQFDQSKNFEFTSSNDLKGYRHVVADECDIPLKVAKKVFSAVGNLSESLLYSNLWKEFPEISFDKREAVCEHRFVKKIEHEAWQKYYILKENRVFNLYGIKKTLDPSQKMSSLYFKLEREIMSKCFKYLDEQNIVYLCMHDGCDLLSDISDFQIEALHELFRKEGLTITIKPLIEDESSSQECSSSRKIKNEYRVYHNDVQHHDNVTVDCPICHPLIAVSSPDSDLNRDDFP